MYHRKPLLHSGQLRLRHHSPHGAASPARIPPDTRVYAVGDIHARLEPLRSLAGAIRQDAASPGPLGEAPPSRQVVVFLGDYIDRGLDSRRVIDFLLADPVPGHETVHLKGNHEALLLEFLDDAATGLDWLPVGGAATLLSYGVAAPAAPFSRDELNQTSADLAEALPDRHLRFLEGLALWHTEGGYTFVHAGLRPKIPLERQKPRDLLWIRDDFTRATNDHGTVVVHGHTLNGQPVSKPNRIGIDTGAYATGRLTAVVLEGETRRFLTTGQRN